MAEHTGCDTFIFICRAWNDVSRMDAMPDIQAIANKKRYLNQKDRDTAPGITMKNLLLNAERTATV